MEQSRKSVRALICLIVKRCELLKSSTAARHGCYAQDKVSECVQIKLDPRLQKEYVILIPMMDTVTRDQV